VVPRQWKVIETVWENCRARRASSSTRWHSPPPEFLPGKGIVDVVVRSQGPVKILVVERLLGKTAIIVRHERRQERVAGLDGRDSGQPHLLDQAVLQCAVGSFHAPLGLWDIGTNDIDVELVQRAAELRHPVAAGGADLVDPERCVLV
jgi:hypothetical protein